MRKETLVLLFIGLLISCCFSDETELQRKKKFIRIKVKIKIKVKIRLWKRNQPVHSEQLSCSFDAWDKNGDGRLTWEEFYDVTRSYSGSRNLHRIFDQTDEDGNDLLSSEEFAKSEILNRNC
ncbi:hypothetical protein MHBO_005281 [Bonamia ostreae]|uniref:EF-hand domain-containing protein n=1 Tax=Bonamia ostreae TaxID=126728 RepID=A0ABV2APK7_9EUKA